MTLSTHTPQQEAPPDPAALQEEIGAYWAAKTVVSAWNAGAQAIALLRAALSSGVLDALRNSSSPAEIAAATGMPEERVTQLLVALDAHGIVERAGDAYTLAADLARLLSPAAIQPLANILNMEGAKAQAIERIGTATLPYTALTPDEHLAVAKGVMGVPASPLWQATMAAMATNGLPEVTAIAETGGRHLELGCGAASMLVTILALYPRMTAVGVDVSAVALTEARRRAEEVGVADRLELRQQDARALPDTACYDVVSWSEHFFPAETRAAALAVAFRALKPGGYLIATAGASPLSAETLRQPEGRAEAMSRLLFGSWGVPALEQRGAEAELTAAGFTITRVVPAAGGLRGAMLAQRPRA
ncbi:MAG: SAM-dependent methyltransferase [Thermomicrobiales bacterium]